MERKTGAASREAVALRWRAAWRRVAGDGALARRVTAIAIPIAIGTIVFAEVRALRAARSSSIDSPRCLVARRALPAGQPISAIDFALGPPGKNVSGAVFDVDIHRFVAARTTIPLAAGDVLTASMLREPPPETPLARRIPKGLRAYSLAGLGDGVAARPGDRVDLFFEPSDGIDAPFIIAEAVPVLRRGERGEWVMALSATAIRTVEKARRRGKLTIALRHPDDSGRSAEPPSRRVRATRSIQILSEAP